MATKLSLLVLAHAAAMTAASFDFAGYRLLKASPMDASQVETLRKVEATATPDDGLEFWSHPGHEGQPVSIAVHPNVLQVLQKALAYSNITYEVSSSDLKSLIEAERASIRSRGEVDDSLRQQDPTRSVYDHTNYNRLSAITAHLEALADGNPDVMSVRSIGQTLNGRPINMATLAVKDGKKRAAIWMDCGIHAREWISPSFCMYTIANLLSEGDNGLLKHYDFYISPVTNPDGYEYTWDTNRMHRKNLRQVTLKSSSEAASTKQTKQWGSVFPGFLPQGGGWPAAPFAPGQPGQQANPNKCVGVDPNRNFDIGFGTSGASDSQCQDTYHGTAPFSEAESAAVRDAIAAIQASNGRIAAFLSVHAYSQLWMSPHGHIKELSPDHADHLRVMRVATDALRSQYGTVFEYGPINKVIYVASGSSVDWAYSKAGIKYSFALELRDKGSYGFLLPVDQIEATNKETWAGLNAMAWEVAKEYPVQ